MTLLNRTKEVAKLRGLSLTDVAIKAGLADKSIYSWDRSIPKADNLSKVAEVLHVSTDYLLGNTNKMNPNSYNTPTDLSTDGVFFFDGKEVDEDTMDYIRETLRRIKK